MTIAPLHSFQTVGEVELDSRKRIPLAKTAKPKFTRYSVSVNDLGEILLVPLASIPAAEMMIWENSELMAQIDRSFEDAAAGRLVDLGDFTQYADESGSQAETE